MIPDIVFDIIRWILLRPFISPETASKIAIWGLYRGFAPEEALESNKGLDTKFFEKVAKNPVGLAAGFDKNAEGLLGLSKIGFGMVEIGTITLFARKGNVGTRIWRLPNIKAIFNWMGLPNKGVSPVILNLIRFKENNPYSSDMLIGASIGVDSSLELYTPEEQIEILSSKISYYVDYVALNASCPNIRHDESLEDIFRLVGTANKNIWNKPLFIKLAPTLDSEALEVMVKGCLEAGADGFIATNTVHFAKADLLENEAVIDNWLGENDKCEPDGGYSGPDLLDISEFMVREIRRIAGDEVFIIGCGGVQTGDDAVRLMKAGANSVQIMTGFIYRGHHLINEIKDSLRVYFKNTQE